MADEKLVDYIKKGVAGGYTLKQLREHITKKGYRPEAIEDAINAAAGNKEENFGDDKRNIKNKNNIARPTSITVIAILFLIGGIFSIIVDVLLLIGASMFGDLINILSAQVYLSSYLYVITIIGIVLSILYIIAAVGLLKIKKWGRIMAIILSIILMITIIGAIPGVIFLILLFRKNVKQAFGIATA